jgi:hypothetical protein
MSKRKIVKETAEQKLLKLKERGEGQLAAFKATLRELNLMGFSVQIKKDDTLYIFKQVTTGYGTPEATKPEEPKQ